MKLFVIGKPLEHSMSPIIQNYWLKKYSKPYSYSKKEVNKDYLPKIIDQIEERKIIGVNVTIPYKKDIFNLLVNLDKNAFYSKAVNTIYKKNDSVFGENTDGAGFCKALEKEKNFKIKNKNILVLGCGGASFGIVSELVNRNAKTIVISNRTKERSFELIENFRRSTTEFKIMEWNKIEPGPKTDLIINTTSYGMKENQAIKIDMKNLKNTTIYSDIIYKPRKTLTMKNFEKNGFTTQNGLGMLINQAAESFRLWFNINLTNKDIIEAKELCEKAY